MTRLFGLGFTGTIASGKTARCHHLVFTAVKRQLPGLSLPLSKVVELTSVHNISTPTSSPQRRLFNDLPVPVSYLSADILAHHIYCPGTQCYHALVSHFGPRILSTERDASGAGAPIDRKVLGAIVFGDQAQRHALNTICWPHIYRAVCETITSGQEMAQNAQKPAQLFILEAALLVDMLGMAITPESLTPDLSATASREKPDADLARLDSVLTDVWMTCCDGAVAVERVMSRDGLTTEAARARVAAQKSASETREALHTLGFVDSHLTVFDTSQISLAAGLQQVEEAFHTYWTQSVAALLTRGP